MQYEWDERKAALNLRKHKVRFTDAVIALEDDLALTVEDDNARGERRFVTIGTDAANILLVVVWSPRQGDTIRIISARKATGTERKAYED